MLGFKGRHERGQVKVVRFQRAVNGGERGKVCVAKIRVAAVRGERRKDARVREHQMHRSEAARRLTQYGTAAFGGDRSIVGVDVTDDVAHGVRCIRAVMNGVDVLRAAQAGEAVDQHDQCGRHALFTHEPIGPLQYVGLPRA